MVLLLFPQPPISPAATRHNVTLPPPPQLPRCCHCAAAVALCAAAGLSFVRLTNNAPTGESTRCDGDVINR